ncbi:hypothetical protein [Rhodohalobacter sp. SW132]|nr:hypothetical protein [Rhodohalobacter sp. SW132]
MSKSTLPGFSQIMLSIHSEYRLYVLIGENIISENQRIISATLRE